MCSISKLPTSFWKIIYANCPKNSEIASTFTLVKRFLSYWSKNNILTVLSHYLEKKKTHFFKPWFYLHKNMLNFGQDVQKNLLKNIKTLLLEMTWRYCFIMLISCNTPCIEIQVKNQVGVLFAVNVIKCNNGIFKGT